MNWTSVWELHEKHLGDFFFQRFQKSFIGGQRGNVKVGVLIEYVGDAGVSHVSQLHLGPLREGF